MSPVRLEENGVDLLEIDGFGVIPHGFDQGTDAEVSDGSERAFGAPGDEVDGFFGEGGMGQPDAVELRVDKVGETGGVYPASSFSRCRVLTNAPTFRVPHFGFGEVEGGEDGDGRWISDPGGT